MPSRRICSALRCGPELQDAPAGGVHPALGALRSGRCLRRRCGTPGAEGGLECGRRRCWRRVRLPGARAPGGLPQPRKSSFLASLCQGLDICGWTCAHGQRSVQREDGKDVLDPLRPLSARTSGGAGSPGFAGTQDHGEGTGVRGRARSCACSRRGCIPGRQGWRNADNLTRRVNTERIEELGRRAHACGHDFRDWLRAAGAGRA